MVRKAVVLGLVAVLVGGGSARAQKTFTLDGVTNTSYQKAFTTDQTSVSSITRMLVRDSSWSSSPGNGVAVWLVEYVQDYAGVNQTAREMVGTGGTRLMEPVQVSGLWYSTNALSDQPITTLGYLASLNAPPGFYRLRFTSASPGTSTEYYQGGQWYSPDVRKIKIRFRKGGAAIGGTFKLKARPFRLNNVGLSSETITDLGVDLDASSVRTVNFADAYTVVTEVPVGTWKLSVLTLTATGQTGDVAITIPAGARTADPGTDATYTVNIGDTGTLPTITGGPDAGGGSTSSGGSYDGPPSTSGWWEDMFVPTDATQTEWRTLASDIAGWGPIGVLNAWSSVWDTAALSGSDIQTFDGPCLWPGDACQGMTLDFRRPVDGGTWMGEARHWMRQALGWLLWGLYVLALVRWARPKFAS